MSNDQIKLQTLTEAYQKLQSDLQPIVTARQKLESQQQENLGVQKVCSTLLPSPFSLLLFLDEVQHTN